MHKILIAEDDLSVRNMYEFKLSQAGYTIVTAKDGLEALAKAEKERPDLILLDVRMPHMHGDEVLERLRAESWSNTIKVIILTNISKDEAPMRLRFLHVDRYVVKAHHTPSQVLEIVKDVLS